MTINVTDYFNKFQQEGLEALKQSQDANIETMSKFRALGTEFAVKPGTIPTFGFSPSI